MRATVLDLMSSSVPPSVAFPVTGGAERNQIRHHIATEPAPGLHVMDTRLRTIAYSFGSSLSRGRFWRRRVEFEALSMGDLWLSFSQAGTGKKIGTNHLQAVAPGFVGSEHQAGSLKCFFDHE